MKKLPVHSGITLFLFLINIFLVYQIKTSGVNIDINEIKLKKLQQNLLMKKAEAEKKLQNKQQDFEQNLLKNTGDNNISSDKIMDILFNQIDDLFLESFNSSKLIKHNSYSEFSVVFNLKGRYEQIMEYLSALTKIVKIEEVLLVQDVSEFILLKVDFKIYYINK